MGTYATCQFYFKAQLSHSRAQRNNELASAKRSLPYSILTSERWNARGRPALPKREGNAGTNYRGPSTLHMILSS